MYSSLMPAKEEKWVREKADFSAELVPAGLKRIELIPPGTPVKASPKAAVLASGLTLNSSGLVAEKTENGRRIIIMAARRCVLIV